MEARLTYLTFQLAGQEKPVAHCVAHSIGERGRKEENRVECRRLKTKGIDGKHAFRNRQVVGSTPTLGSSFFYLTSFQPSLRHAFVILGSSYFPPFLLPDSQDRFSTFRILHFGATCLVLIEEQHRISVDRAPPPVAMLQVFVFPTAPQVQSSRTYPRGLHSKPPAWSAR